jgi:membrane protease YdiL (CAAX protease family)
VVPAGCLLGVAVLVSVVATWRYRRGGWATSCSYGIFQSIVLTLGLLFAIRYDGIALVDIGIGPISFSEFLMETVGSILVVAGIDFLVVRHALASASKYALASVPQQNIPGSDSRAAKNFQFVALCFFSAIWEELWFRGVPLYFAGSQTSSIAAVVGLSSLVFGLQHIQLGPRSAIYSAAYGVLFSVLYLFTDHLVPVIIAHICGNVHVIFYVRPRLSHAIQVRERKHVPF